jgi:preprotein translocase subunit YajC
MGTQGNRGGGGGFAALLPFVLIFFVFYLLLIRPQQKKHRQHQQMLGSLRKGDKVVTSGGIHGVVVGINDKKNIVVLRVAENVKIEFQKNTIATSLGEGEKS